MPHHRTATHALQRVRHVLLIARVCLGMLRQCVSHRSERARGEALHATEIRDLRAPKVLHALVVRPRHVETRFEVAPVVLVRARLRRGLDGVCLRTVRALAEVVRQIDHVVTRNEAEALHLEQNLIKRHRAPFNVRLRDDKSYPYLVLTKHDFPRLAFHRGSLDPQHRYFGPFPNAGAVRESMQLLQKLVSEKSTSWNLEEDQATSKKASRCFAT